MLNVQTKRPTVSLGSDPLTLAEVLSEGNPAAVNVVAQLLARFGNNDDIFLHIDDMNLRGPRLAVAFHLADSNVEVLNILVRSRDHHLVYLVNQMTGAGAFRNQAMCSGGANLK